jgi:hypothetical protein
MSFYNAAIFDENNDESFLNNKRKQHSKTQKNYKENFGNFDKGKVNSVLEALHNNQKPEDED